MSWLIRLLPYGLFLALVLFLGFVINEHGAHMERQRIELQQTKGELANERFLRAKYALQVEQAEKGLADYRKRAERVRTITKEITREVPVFVPADSCPLPAGFRVLHDAAAVGEAPDPSAAGRADGGPVAAQDAAETVVENYGQYHQLAERFRALQRYVTEQLK